ncbi:hypothetical protein [Rhodovarius lipocyclicus]|uniref:hypothetical protein n=1 Tax=Rhodovarius lipocyclicus TaxID=268410 RepID=UPI00135C7E3A|nr:hypothetical protein [Rhodovarius lipocyclicus]
MSKPIPRPPGYDPAVIGPLTVEVYKKRLGPYDTARMLEKDDDGGEKLARRAKAYEPIVKATLDALSDMARGQA